MVGSLGTLLDIGIYAGLRKMGMWHWHALAISFTTGIVIGFLLTRLWVFERHGTPWKGQLLRFLLVILVMYFVNGLAIQYLYVLLPAAVWRSFAARSLAALGTFPLSYMLHRRISFA